MNCILAVKLGESKLIGDKPQTAEKIPSWIPTYDICDLPDEMHLRSNAKI